MYLNYRLSLFSFQVKNTASFWTWFDNELVSTVYDPRLYNEFGDFHNNNGDGLIKSKNGYTVGLPRIRQIRFKPGKNIKILDWQHHRYFCFFYFYSFCFKGGCILSKRSSKPWLNPSGYLF